MFLLDPYEGLSREEVLDKTFKTRLSPAQQAQCLKDAAARGLTYMELLQELAASYDVMMADPVERDKWLTIHGEMERRLAMPLGQDPRLGKDGHHAV